MRVESLSVITVGVGVVDFIFLECVSGVGREWDGCIVGFGKGEIVGGWVCGFVCWGWV